MSGKKSGTRHGKPYSIGVLSVTCANPLADTKHLPLKDLRRCRYCGCFVRCRDFYELKRICDWCAQVAH